MIIARWALAAVAAAPCVAFVMAERALAAEAPAILRNSAEPAPFAPPAATRSRTVAIDLAALQKADPAAASGTIALDLFSGRALTLEVLRVEPRASGFAWHGRVAGDPLGTFAFTLYQGHFVGGIWSQSGTFDLQPVGRSDDAGRPLCVLSELDPHKTVVCGGSPMQPDPAPPPAHAGFVTPRPDAAGGGAAREAWLPRGPSCACADTQTRVDVLCVYTTLAKDAAGGAALLEARIQNALDAANGAYVNSEVGPLMLAAAEFREIGYDEVSPSWSDHLVRLTEPADGFMDEVHAWRDAAHADLVALFVDDLRFTGGQGFWSPFGARFAFSCCNWRGTGGGDLLLAHETGHNYGCSHERENDSESVFPYSWGYHFDVGDTTFGTIMSYTGTVHIQYYSNPRVEFLGTPVGAPMGSPFPSDNALCISQTKWALANHRQSGRLLDVNGNSVADAIDIGGGASLDVNGNCRPDESEYRLFVDANAPVDGDGLSWATARRDLAGALYLATLPCGNVKEVWVADGVYKPDSGSGDRLARFRLHSGVAVYGGFQGQSRPGGGETALGQRDPVAHPTILSGEIGAPEDHGDNSYTLVEANGTDANAVLDGFVVEDGDSIYGSVGVWCVGGAARFRNCIFRSNVGWDAAAAGVLAGSDVRFEDCVFEYNDSYSGSGAVVVDDSNAEFVRCRFEGNLAEWGGGGLAVVNGSEITAIDCPFLTNGAWFGAGAILRDGSLGTFSGCTFNGNIAEIGGGALDLTAGSSATITGSQIVFNDAGTGGGGGLTASDGCVVVLSHSTISDNVCGGNGGAANVYDGTHLDVIDVVAERNSADSGGAFAYYDAGTTGNVAVSTIRDNEAANNGGGFDIWGAAPTISDCEITLNRAASGGGVHVGTDADVTLTDAIVSANTSTNSGGGIQNYQGDLAATSCVIEGNSAGAGGALAGYLSGYRLVNCAVRGNSADGDGGALQADAVTADLFNCLVWDNHSGANGGAVLANLGATVTIVNGAVAGNTAVSGAGAALYGSAAITLRNSIVWQNAASGGGSVEGQQLSIVFGSATLERCNVSGWSGALGGVGNSGANPLFVDLAGGDLRLAPGSPCIDSGANAALPADLALDLAGAPRYVDDPATADTGVAGNGHAQVVDRGAYEFQPAFCYGDLNCDAVVNFDDIDAFITALVSESAYNATFPGCRYLNADTNRDGQVNFDDIDSFVFTLISGGCG